MPLGYLLVGAFLWVRGRDTLCFCLEVSAKLLFSPFEAVAGLGGYV